MHSKFTCYDSFVIDNNIDLLEQILNDIRFDEWLKVKPIQGELKIFTINETDNSEAELNIEDNSFLPKPADYKAVTATDNFQCRVEFYCEDKDYFHKKYDITKTHSDVIELSRYINSGNVLDLGFGTGRNSLFLNQLGCNVTAVEYDLNKVAFLNHIIDTENLQNINVKQYDINLANITHNYDAIISTVVFMFLQQKRVADIIYNMQQHTNINGYNLIVSAMQSEDYPCILPFTALFKPNELKKYYDGWQIIKYNEDVGQLHKTDMYGNRIKMRFATLIAKKIV